MVQDDPEKRPNMDVVVERFGEILSNLSWWTLSTSLDWSDRSGQITPPRSNGSVRQFLRIVGNVLFSRNPLPTPRK